MKKWLYCLALVLAACFRPPHASVAIVVLQAEGEELGSGSAFAVSDYELITAGHVCEDAEEEGADLVSPRLGVLEIMAQDPSVDLCLLKSRVPVTPLPIADYSHVHVDDKAYLLGFPLGVGDILTSGTVADPYYLLDGYPYLMLSLPAMAGNSGSPVMNEFGEVIGVLVLGSRAYPQLCFATTGSDLVRFLYWAHQPE
jgi:S1-C subfamily serine protease